MNGIIFNIQKFCVNDGPGIRTTVFLKGCPLRCLWCHNPESQSPKSEIMFYKDKCVGCRRCADVCENECHTFVGTAHNFNRENCRTCFKCTALYCDALEKVGREATSDEIIDEVIKDKIFYDNSGGGMTLSGGEPFAQFDFSLELLKKAKANGLHTAIETCGFVSRDRLKQAAEYIDLFLFDCKETDFKLHKSFTGVDNELILSNLKLLDALGKDIILRCPIIPGCNDRHEHFKAVAALANELEHILHIELEPYHSLGEGKYSSLGQNEHAFSSPSDEQKQEWLTLISQMTDKKVKFA